MPLTATYNGGIDLLLMRLQANGNGANDLVYGTYLGGSADESEPTLGRQERYGRLHFAKLLPLTSPPPPAHLMKRTTADVILQSGPSISRTESPTPPFSGERPRSPGQ